MENKHCFIFFCNNPSRRKICKMSKVVKMNPKTKKYEVCNEKMIIDANYGKSKTLRFTQQLDDGSSIYLRIIVDKCGATYQEIKNYCEAKKYKLGRGKRFVQPKSAIDTPDIRKSANNRKYKGGRRKGKVTVRKTCIKEGKQQETKTSTKVPVTRYINEGDDHFEVGLFDDNDSPVISELLDNEPKPKSTPKIVKRRRQKFIVDDEQSTGDNDTDSDESKKKANAGQKEKKIHEESISITEEVDYLERTMTTSTEKANEIVSSENTQFIVDEEEVDNIVNAEERPVPDNDDKNQIIMEGRSSEVEDIGATVTLVTKSTLQSKETMKEEELMFNQDFFENTTDYVQDDDTLKVPERRENKRQNVNEQSISVNEDLGVPDETPDETSTSSTSKMEGGKKESMEYNVKNTVSDHDYLASDIAASTVNGKIIINGEIMPAVPEDISPVEATSGTSTLKVNDYIENGMEKLSEECVQGTDNLDNKDETKVPKEPESSVTLVTVPDTTVSDEKDADNIDDGIDDSFEKEARNTMESIRNSADASLDATPLNKGKGEPKMNASKPIIKKVEIVKVPFQSAMSGIGNGMELAVKLERISVSNIMTKIPMKAGSSAHHGERDETSDEGTGKNYFSKEERSLSTPIDNSRRKRKRVSDEEVTSSSGPEHSPPTKSILMEPKKVGEKSRRSLTVISQCSPTDATRSCQTPRNDTLRPKKTITSTNSPKTPLTHYQRGQQIKVLKMCESSPPRRKRVLTGINSAGTYVANNDTDDDELTQKIRRVVRAELDIRDANEGNHKAQILPLPHPDDERFITFGENYRYPEEEVHNATWATKMSVRAKLLFASMTTKEERKNYVMIRKGPDERNVISNQLIQSLIDQCMALQPYNPIKITRDNLPSVHMRNWISKRLRDERYDQKPQIIVRKAQLRQQRMSLLTEPAVRRTESNDSGSSDNEIADEPISVERKVPQRNARKTTQSRNVTSAAKRVPERRRMEQVLPNIVLDRMKPSAYKGVVNDINNVNVGHTSDEIMLFSKLTKNELEKVLTTTCSFQADGKWRLVDWKFEVDIFMSWFLRVQRRFGKSNGFSDKDLRQSLLLLVDVSFEFREYIANKYTTPMNDEHKSGTEVQRFRFREDRIMEAAMFHFFDDTEAIGEDTLTDHLSAISSDVDKINEAIRKYGNTYRDPVNNKRMVKLKTNRSSLDSFDIFSKNIFRVSNDRP